MLRGADVPRSPISTWSRRSSTATSTSPAPVPPRGQPARGGDVPHRRPRLLRTSPYWDPEALLETATISPAEAAERFRELLAQAVARMLTGRTPSQSGASTRLRSPRIPIASTAGASAGRFRRSRPSTRRPRERRERLHRARAARPSTAQYEPGPQRLDRLQFWLKLFDGPWSTWSPEGTAERCARARARGIDHPERRVRGAGRRASAVSRPHLLWRRASRGALVQLAHRGPRGLGRRRLLEKVAGRSQPRAVRARDFRRPPAYLPAWIDLERIGRRGDAGHARRRDAGGRARSCPSSAPTRSARRTSTRMRSTGSARRPWATSTSGSSSSAFRLGAVSGLPDEGLHAERCSAWCRTRSSTAGTRPSWIAGSRRWASTIPRCPTGSRGDFRMGRGRLCKARRRARARPDAPGDLPLGQGLRHGPRLRRPLLVAAPSAPELAPPAPSSSAVPDFDLPRFPRARRIRRAFELQGSLTAGRRSLAALWAATRRAGRSGSAQNGEAQRVTSPRRPSARGRSRGGAPRGVRPASCARRAAPTASGPASSSRPARGPRRGRARRPRRVRLGEEERDVEHVAQAGEGIRDPEVRGENESVRGRWKREDAVRLRGTARSNSSSTGGWESHAGQLGRRWISRRIGQPAQRSGWQWCLSAKRSASALWRKAQAGSSVGSKPAASSSACSRSASGASRSRSMYWRSAALG